MSPIAYLVKRCIDVFVAITGGIIALPCMIVIAAAVKLSSPGPVIYGQERIGRGGRKFRVWKFRTMFSDAEEVLEDFLDRCPELKAEWERERKLSSDPRVVPGIGQFLRKSSLDELPQFWNVINGDMSLVGPRPLPEYHLAQFDRSFRQYREKVTPGITGLWQVSSRGNGHPEMYISLRYGLHPPLVVVAGYEDSGVDRLGRRFGSRSQLAGPTLEVLRTRSMPYRTSSPYRVRLTSEFRYPEPQAAALR